MNYIKIKPSFSWGWLFPFHVFLLSFFVFLSCVYLPIVKGLPQKTYIFISILIASILNCLIATLGILYTIFFFTMNYKLTPEQLILKCGWHKKTIYYNQIEKVTIENLKANFLADTQSVFKVPGYAIGKVYYFGKGYIYMCATRVNKNILVIYLRNGEKVGITPKNLEEFKNILIEKAGLK